MILLDFFFSQNSSFLLSSFENSDWVMGIYRFIPFIKCPATFLTATLDRANYCAKIDQILHAALFYDYIWVYRTDFWYLVSGPRYGPKVKIRVDSWIPEVFLISEPPRLNIKKLSSRPIKFDQVVCSISVWICYEAWATATFELNSSN